jgi:hypothetical protein
MTWGFWEGAHWKPSAAMIRRDWSTKPNYDAWNDLIYRQWWTDTSGVTAGDGTFRTRAFLGDYDIEITIEGTTKTYPLTLTSNTEPAFVSTGKPTDEPSIPMAWSMPQASPVGGIAGEIVTIFGSGFSPPALALAQYTNGRLPQRGRNARALQRRTSPDGLLRRRPGERHCALRGLGYRAGPG